MLTNISLQFTMLIHGNLKLSLQKGHLWKKLSVLYETKWF